jgi:hypothetical protein
MRGREAVMKHSLLRKLLWALILLLVSHAAADTGVLPTGQPEYEFIYDRLEHLEALSHDRFDYQLGPYDMDHVQNQLGPFSSLHTTSTAELTLFGVGAERMAAKRYLRPERFASFRGGVAGRPLQKLFVYGSFVVDEALAEDVNYSGKKWRGFAGDVQDAFVYFSSGRFDLTVGRFAAFWGPRNSLVMSPEQRLDGLCYSFRWGRLVLSYRLARLDGLSPEEDSVEQFENRFFAAHRLDFHFNDRLRAGLFETVLFGGPGRQIDLFYLNPLIFFHGSQVNEGINDNTTVGFDFSYKPALGYKVYGQMLIDDYQIDNEAQSDQEPAEIAFTLGGYAADLLNFIDVRLEYQHVSNRTFNQVFARNRYVYNNRPIGAVLGNDYDLTSFSVIRWLRPQTSLTLGFAYHRQGEGRIISEWTEPWSLVEGDYDEPFPTGVVEKTSTISLSVKSFIKDCLFVRAECGADWITNADHLDGQDRTVLFARLAVSGFLLTTMGLE